MTRTILIAGNWKLNLTVDEGNELIAGIKPAADAGTAEVLVCPTFLGIHPAAQIARGSKVQVGGQNCFWEEQGAYTAEVSASLLKAAGASHVILGHSERRQFFGETDETVNRRLRAVLAQDLVPVVCVGETLEERQGGRLETVLRTQVLGGLAGLGQAELGSLVVAYEPVWAIGTGEVATSGQAQEAHAFVRSLLREQLADQADAVRILYGGSVKPDNAADLLSQPDIDGALVGGASLKADSFSGIIAAAG